VVKYALITAVLIVFTATGIKAETLVVPPEIPTSLELSNRDINRIVCPGTINDLIFSEEKRMTGHFSGNNAFIKFKVEQLGEKDFSYADTPSELFVVCDNTVYTIITTPKDIPSVTLRLAPAQGKNLQKNIADFKELPLEKRVLQVIHEAFSGIFPSSYRVTETSVPVTLTPDLEVKLIQIVDVDGVGLRLKKYAVKSLVQHELMVEEKTFLTPQIGNTLLAVAVDTHDLQIGASTLAFVVEQKEQDQ
jgi:conjugal transfer pilus assembly protein TraK